ncbi:MAG: sigma-54-dependent Fis family transcriptional regulator, partial [Akkermansia sp.]|nr:sigma-54-dependent Fis family transcriptional regulator [Akkermansia sp.]
PGNVRQLRTAVEHGVVMSESDRITLADLPQYLLPKSAPTVPDASQKNIRTDFGLDFGASFNLQYIVQSTILRALEHTQGNRSSAAALLGINRRTLQRKMAESPEVFRQYLN